MLTTFQICLCFMLMDVFLAKSIQNESDIGTKDDTMVTKMELFELNLKNISETILQMQREKEDERKRPMFFVRLSSDITLQTWSIVKFNTKVIDEGDNFNAGDGIFIAPVSGVYMFSWTIQEYTNNLAITELRVDNVVKGILSISLSSSESRNVATRILFCQVQKGDHVWIQTRGGSGSNYFNVYHDSKSSFMGVLMKRL